MNGETQKPEGAEDFDAKAAQMAKLRKMMPDASDDTLRGILGIDAEKAHQSNLEVQAEQAQESADFVREKVSEGEANGILSEEDAQIHEQRAQSFKNELEK